MIAVMTRHICLRSSVRLTRWALLCLCSIMLVTGCDRKSEPKPKGAGDKTGASTATIPLDDHGNTHQQPVTSLTMAQPLPKPTETMASGATCVTSQCHATYQTATRIHGPVALNNCTSCHEDDKGAHSFPMKRQGDATCTFCHSVTGSAKHMHKAVTVGGCTSCHDPHVSGTKFLLVADNVEQLCQRCHNIPWQKHAHQPFAAGQCTLCHQPHESNSEKLLRGGNEPEHCFSCHSDMKNKMVSATTVHKPAQKQCSTCHNPHTSPNPFELKSPINDNCLSCHKKFGARVATAKVSHDAILMNDDKTGGCANCHDAHAAQDPKLLKARADELCMTCHNKPVKAHDGHMVADMRDALSRKFQHGPVKSGDCTACHNVHGASHERLLVKMFPEKFYANFDLENYALCFTCHNSELVLTPKTSELTGFRNGDVNLHFVHVNRDEKGRTCKTCHDIHGSDLPNHMAEGVPFEGSNWAMPIRFERQASGGSCAPGCHQPMTYDRSAAITSDITPAQVPVIPAQGGQP